jgi:exosortase D (VPLPA-CTERM-specific)
MEKGFQIRPLDWLQAGIYALLIGSIYASSLRWLVVNDWEREGYSYCYLIPFVLLYLLWLKWSEFRAVKSKPSWLGLFPLLLGLFFFWLGELGGEFLTLYVSMWLVLIGLCWMHFGWKKLKAIGFPLFFVLTMFPLPAFLNTKLMLHLRLISSKLGMAMIHLYGFPAYREGNIIDLGFTQLQVVEACSGLHSFISLVVLCLLLVYFFKDHWWKRAVLLISSVPLAIITNSMRIAVTSMLYKHWGADVAQSFFHGFSGLLIFFFCVPVLLIEMKILGKLPPYTKKVKPTEDDKDKKQILYPNTTNKYRQNSISTTLRQPVFIVAVIFLGATLAFSTGIEFREKIPVKKSLVQFPLRVGEWTANGSRNLEQMFIDTLDLSDYVLIDYRNRPGKSVNLYVAYYETQSKGKSIHSPATCLPGSGWDFRQSGSVTIFNTGGDNCNMRVNRAVMQKGRQYQLSYYWFPQRGRILTNAYQLKLFAFWDSLTKQRTDGALVRLTTPVYDDEKIEESEERLQQFVRAIVPILKEYIPGKEIGVR